MEISNGFEGITNWEGVEQVARKAEEAKEVQAQHDWAPDRRVKHTAKGKKA